MIQLNRIQLTSQTPNHVEMTKILSTSQRESRVIDCQCLSRICFARYLRLQNTVFFTFISLLHILFHQQKVSLYNKIPLLIVSKNCLGKQFTKKFLGTCTTNGSLKIVLCSIVQEPATEVFTPFSRKVLTNQKHC